MQHFFEQGILNLEPAAAALEIPENHCVLPFVAHIAFVGDLPVLGVSDLGVTELLAQDQRNKSVVLVDELGLLVLLLNAHPLHHVLFIEH